MPLVDMLKTTLPKYSETIPSTGKKIYYRPFLVKEEKTLLMAQEVGDEESVLLAIKEIIESCFPDIKDASKIPLFDLEYLFLKLRAKSVMEIANPILICPDTKEKVKLVINLNNIKVKTDKTHTTELQISNDIIIGMKYPSLSTLLEKNLNSASLMDFYEMAINCIKFVQTKEEKIETDSLSKEEVKAFVDSMTKPQFDKIIEFFATMPRIEEEIEYKTSDGVTRKVLLKGIKDFFE
jgi:hypothetical protein